MSEVTCALHAVLDVLRTAGLLTEVRGSEDVVVRGVSQDSRTTVKDDLFLAWKGTQDDAHDFVPGAVGRGASAVVVERPLQVDVPQLVVRDGRRAAALAADVVLGSPSARMAVVGVTGTNGKTTTSLLVRHLVSPETRSAVIGTLGLTLKDGVRAATEDLTTPGPSSLPSGCVIFSQELRNGSHRSFFTRDRAASPGRDLRCRGLYEPSQDH